MSGKTGVERLLAGAGSMFLRAEAVKPGDTVRINSVKYEEDERFGPRLVVEGVLERTREPVRVRLGAQNVRRISETLGRDEAEWIGHIIEVVGIESYPGLAKMRGVPEAKGIVWRGVRSSPELLNERVKGFLKAHASQIGVDLPGFASNIEADVLAEAERRGLIELFEVKGRRMYVLTEAGKRLAGA